MPGRRVDQAIGVTLAHVHRNIAILVDNDVHTVLPPELVELGRHPSGWNTSQRDRELAVLVVADEIEDDDLLPTLPLDGEPGVVPLGLYDHVLLTHDRLLSSA